MSARGFVSNWHSNHRSCTNLLLAGMASVTRNLRLECSPVRDWHLPYKFQPIDNTWTHKQLEVRACCQQEFHDLILCTSDTVSGFQLQHIPEQYMNWVWLTWNTSAHVLLNQDIVVHAPGLDAGTRASDMWISNKRFNWISAVLCCMPKNLMCCVHWWIVLMVMNVI